MADTYGYNPDGSKKYDPSQYDQWGSFMGNRAPMIAGADTSAAKGFNQWTSEQPFEQWLTGYAQSQLKRNRGPLAAVTAAQGTPEYRDQVAAAQRDADLISGWGGTVGDMGLRPAKGAGLNMWNQYAGNKPGQIADWARAQARTYYDRAAAQRAAGGQAAPAGGTGFGGSTSGGSFTPGTGGVAPSTPTQMNAPAAHPMASPQPMPGTTPGFGAPSGNPSMTDSYMQTPRGGKRGLRALIG